MRIDPHLNPELNAMLEGANRPDLIRDGFDVDAEAVRELLEEQDRLHPGTSCLWKEAHAVYSAYFRNKPKPAASIELDPPATPEEGQTKVFRAMNAFLADSAVTREAVTGGLKALASTIADESKATLDALAALADSTVTVTNKSIDRITGSIASNTDATVAAADVIAASMRLAADQISDSERQTATAVRAVRDAHGETNAHLGAIGKGLADLAFQQGKDATAVRSLLLDVKNEAGVAATAQAGRDVEIRGVIQSGMAELIKSARRREMAGYGRLILLIAILLAVALRGNAQSSVIQGQGSAGTPKGGVVTVQGAPGGTALPVAAAVSTAADGALTCYISSTASTNATSCKGSAGNVYGIYIINTTTTNYFLRMYNSSSSPTCSSATGFVETVVALGASANGGGISRMQAPQAFSTGIGFCLTGGGSSTDNTNAATGVYITILYK